MNLTKEKFLAWAKKKENRNVALLYCKAKAFAEVERKRVDAYILPIFKTYGFREDHKYGEGHTPTNNLIEDPDDLYLCDDPRLPEYYEETYKAHTAHGWTGERTHCPALVAENLVIQAENAVLKLGEELTGIAPEQLYGDNRKKMLDLLIGALLAKK